VEGGEALFEVEADQLLVARDDAQLGDGGRVLDALEGAVDALLAQPVLEQAPGLVVADQPDDPRAGAEEATLRATLPAPPARSSSPSTCTTGTGASGEMRAVAPCQ
jgi:hypothetical protein